MLFRQVYLGEDHEWLAMATSGVGRVLMCLGRNREATAFFEDALAMRIRLHGDEHVRVAESLINFGIAQRHQRRYEEAININSKARAIFSKFLRIRE